MRTRENQAAENVLTWELAASQVGRRLAGSSSVQSPATASKFQPYRRGVPSKRSRLAPKVSAATRATIPAVTPTRVVRTGTSVGPRPCSRAIRSPTTELAGRPARSEEHTSELQSHRDLHSFPTRRSSDPGGDPDQGCSDWHLRGPTPLF